MKSFRKPITMDGETCDRITVDTLKEHYPLLNPSNWWHKKDKKMYRKVKKAFRTVLRYYGETVK